MPLQPTPYAPLPFVRQVYEPDLRFADLLRAQGQDAAEAARRRGDIQAQLFGNLANIIGHLPQQAQQAKEEGLKQQIGALQLKRVQGDEQSQQALEGLQAGSGLRPGDQGPTQPNPFLTQEGDTHVWDVAKLSAAMAAQGKPLTSESLDQLAKTNKAIRDEQEGRVAQQDKQRQTIAASAQLAGHAIDQGMAPADAVDLVGSQLRTNPSIPPDQLAATLDSLKSDPAQIRAKLKALEGPPQLQKFGAGESGVDINAVGGPKVVFTAPPKAGEGDYTINGQRFTKGAQPIGSVVPTQTAPKGLESRPVLLDGQSAFVSFDPTSGKYTLPTGEDVSARVKPIPAASVIVNQQNAATAAKAIDPNSKEGRIAQDLASGKLTFQNFTRLYPARGQQGASLRASVYDYARELNPAFDPAQFEAGFKMATNPQVTQRLVAINALSPVIDQISALAATAGNTDIPAFNKLLMGAKFQLGNRTITNFKQLQVLLGDEVGNALGVGTGSDLKTKLGLDLVNPNLGPQQFLDTMQQLRSVLDARRDTLTKTMGVYGQGAGAVPAAQPSPASNRIYYDAQGNRVTK